jgi:hypothetical protein
MHAPIAIPPSSSPACAPEISTLISFREGHNGYILSNFLSSQDLWRNKWHCVAFRARSEFPKPFRKSGRCRLEYWSREDYPSVVPSQVLLWIQPMSRILSADDLNDFITPVCHLCFPCSCVCRLRCVLSP